MNLCFEYEGIRLIAERHIHLIVQTAVVLNLLCGGTNTKAMALERFEFSEPHLGTTVQLTLYAPNESVANDAAVAAFKRIEELNGILSDYKSDSELKKLCATAGTGQAIPVSVELFEVCAGAVKFSEATDGAFDVTVAPVVKLWRSARRLKKLPDPDQLLAARKLVGWKNIRLDPSARTIGLRQAGMAIDFGGIAKGYIADQARQQLRDRGLRQCLVAVAGDISAGDPPPEAEGWRIGVAPLDKPDGVPSRFLRLANCAISTSGDAFQFVEIDGVRYSHIVDPATGLGLTRRSSVTVVAPRGIDADALATSVSVLGLERGLKLIEANEGTGALFVRVENQGISATETGGFQKFLDKHSAPPPRR